MLNEKEEKELGNSINGIVLLTLRLLKTKFEEYHLTDLQATGALHYYLHNFIGLAWKKNRPSEILQNIMPIFKAIENKITALEKKR